MTGDMVILVIGVYAVFGALTCFVAASAESSSPGVTLSIGLFWPLVLVFLAVAAAVMLYREMKKTWKEWFL